MRAFTLLETLVALGLLAILIPLALNLLPGGLVAQRRAEELQQATAFANGWIQEAQAAPPDPGTDRNQVVTVGHLRYQATRKTVTVGVRTDLRDVIVTLMPLQGGKPIQLSTRVFVPDQ